MKNTQLSRVVLAGTTAFGIAILSSCTPSKITYKDAGNPEGKIVRIGKIDQQDWGMAASDLATKLISDGGLIRTDGKSSILSIGRIQNKTQEHIETSLLVKKIRIAIMKSKQARITTAVGVGGPEDPSTMKVRKELRDNEEFDQGNVAAKRTMKAPTFSLSGKIIETGAAAGKVKQSTFIFQLTLTDLIDGTSVWEGEKEIVKQGRGKASVGF